MTLSIMHEPDTQLHKGTVRVTGRFRFNGSSAPTSVIGRGISSVAHTSTGVWTVTLDSELQNAVGLVKFQATLELDASAVTFVTQGAVSLSAGTFIVRAYTESTGAFALADVAAGSNNGNWCHLDIELKFSGAEDGSGLV